MIVGLGIDIVELNRIRRAYGRFGQGFARRILTSAELTRMPSEPVVYLASRFAVKEAAVKALGTGFSQGITFHDIEVTSDPQGKPVLNLLNTARRRFDDLGASRAHLSLSHGRDSSVAVVILEA